MTPYTHSHRRIQKQRGALRGGGLAMLALAAATACSLLALSAPLSAAIQGSAHDFSALSPDQEICVFCHTAHNADITVTDAPLWNHQVTTKVYQVYNSPTMDSVAGQPTGASRLCLSCHDGTVAVDSYGGNTGSAFMGGVLAVGADELNNDHPISITYDDTLAALDGALFAPSSSPSGLGGTIKKNLLFNDRLECASCHDVHNGGNAAAVNDNLLVITRANSQLCLTCHNK